MASLPRHFYAAALLGVVGNLLGMFEVDAGTLQYAGELSDENRRTIIDKHNEKRRLQGASNMKKMHWDDDLEAQATHYATNCNFVHPPKLADGENLGVSSAGFWELFEILIDAWYGEIDDFDYDTNTCQEEQVCGHYTQLVWANSGYIGCGVAKCSSIDSSPSISGGWIVVCRYRPAGNVNGQLPFLKGTGCSECSAGYDICDDGLCDQEQDTEETTTAVPTTYATPPATTESTSAETTAAPTSQMPTDTTAEETTARSLTSSPSPRITSDGTTTQETPGSTSQGATITGPVYTTSKDQETTAAYTTPPPTDVPTSGCSALYLEALREYRQMQQEWKAAFQEWKDERDSCS